jgi:hypothetical protein
MSRVALLRAGYAAFCVAFLAVAVTIQGAGVAFFLGLLAALVAGFLLAFSRDELPKWAGLALLAYFGLTILAFLAATPVTIDKGGGYFVNDKPSATFQAVSGYLVLAFPIMLGGAALAAAWERERGPKTLLFAALAASVVWAVLSFALLPPSAQATAAQSQNHLLDLLAVAACLVGAAGALWAALRPDEYA